MKKITLSFLIHLTFYQISAQCNDRYLSEIFLNVDKTENIFYAPEAYPSSSKHIMDVYTPSNDIEDNRPLILYLHGGSFYAGSKDLVDCQDFCTNMARRGYVTASLNYRLSSPTLFLLSATEQYQTVLEAVSDIKAAIRFFRKDYATNNNSFGIDPNTIFIGGYSAGAVLAIHLAYIDNISDLPISPVNVQGLVNSIGGDLEGDGGNYGYSSECQGVISFAGGINDVSWIDNNDEPLVSVQGTADLTVNYNCGPGQNIPSVLTLCGSGEMHQQADNMGLINDKLIFNNVDHSWAASGAQDSRFNQAVNFTADFLYPLLPCNQSTNTFELNKKSKYVIKKVNVLGQDSKSSLNYPMFYIYNDGSVEKKVMLQINN